MFFMIFHDFQVSGFRIFRFHDDDDDGGGDNDDATCSQRSTLPLCVDVVQAIAVQRGFKRDDWSVSQRWFQLFIQIICLYLLFLWCFLIDLAPWIRNIIYCIHWGMHVYFSDTYMHACMHAYTHTHIHTHIHPSIHPCMHACMHTCIHAYMQTCRHADMQTCRHALHCITLHYITIHIARHITLHCITLHYITLPTYIFCLHTYLEHLCVLIYYLSTHIFRYNNNNTSINVLHTHTCASYVYELKCPILICR